MSDHPDIHHRFPRWNSFLSTVVFFCWLFTTACSESPVASADSGYFDAETFFSQEQVRLLKAGAVHKYSAWNGVRDSGEVNIKDWKKELEPFSRCSIHRSSLRNSYNVDTLHEGNQVHLVYTAREKLPVQRVEVWKQDEVVRRFAAVTGDTNAVFGLRRELVYNPDSGYEIIGRQDMKMMAPAVYTIRVTW